MCCHGRALEKRIYHATNSTVVLKVLKTPSSRVITSSRLHWPSPSNLTQTLVVIGRDVMKDSTCVLNNCCVMERQYLPDHTVSLCVHPVE